MGRETRVAKLRGQLPGLCYRSVGGGGISRFPPRLLPPSLPRHRSTCTVLKTTPFCARPNLSFTAATNTFYTSVIDTSNTQTHTLFFVCVHIKHSIVIVYVCVGVCDCTSITRILFILSTYFFIFFLPKMVRIFYYYFVEEITTVFPSTQLYVYTLITHVCLFIYLYRISPCTRVVVCLCNTAWAITKTIFWFRSRESETQWRVHVLTKTTVSYK